jgi:hypothetical protein
MCLTHMSQKCHRGHLAVDLFRSNSQIDKNGQNSGRAQQNVLHGTTARRAHDKNAPEGAHSFFIFPHNFDPSAEKGCDKSTSSGLRLKLSMYEYKYGFSLPPRLNPYNFPFCIFIPYPGRNILT